MEGEEKGEEWKEEKKGCVDSYSHAKHGFYEQKYDLLEDF